MKVIKGIEVIVGESLQASIHTTKYVGWNGIG